MHNETMLQGPKRQIHSIVYEDTDEDLVKKEAIKAKGGNGLLRLDTDNYHRILVSSQFFSSPLDPQTSMANVVKYL